MSVDDVSHGFLELGMEFGSENVDDSNKELIFGKVWVRIIPDVADGLVSKGDQILGPPEKFEQLLLFDGKLGVHELVLVPFDNFL